MSSRQSPPAPGPDTGVRVRDVMRRDFIDVAPDADLWAATRLMGMARVRDLPVVEGGVLRGMVSHRDLAPVLLERLRGGGRAALAETIAPWVRGDAPTVGPDTSLRDAAATMVRAGRPCLAAVDGGRLVGLLVEADLLRAAFEPGSLGL
jgi:CBS domain-containing protein